MPLFYSQILLLNSLDTFFQEVLDFLATALTYRLGRLDKFVINPVLFESLEMIDIDLLLSNFIV